nr:hypothetical protein [uncultured Pseudodesulfovibrio sp.]
MRRLMLTMILILSLSTICSAQSFVEDFRGVPWNVTFEDFSAQFPVDISATGNPYADTTWFYLKGENHTLGTLPLRRVAYVFKRLDQYKRFNVGQLIIDFEHEESMIQTLNNILEVDHFVHKTGELIWKNEATRTAAVVSRRSEYYVVDVFKINN